MKKRKMNIAGKTGMAAVLFLTMLGMDASGIMAMDDAKAEGPVITQEAVWSTEKEGYADVTWHVRGLHTYITERGTAFLEQGTDIGFGSQDMQNPAEAASERPGETYGEASGEAAGEMYGETSEEAAGGTYEETSGETAGEIYGEMSGEADEAENGETAEEIPEESYPENTEETYDGMSESCMEEICGEEYAESVEQQAGDTEEAGGGVPAADAEEMYSAVYTESGEDVSAEIYDEMTGLYKADTYGSEHIQVMPSEKMQKRNTGGYTVQNMVYFVPVSAQEGQTVMPEVSSEYPEDAQIQPAFYVVDYVSEYFTVVQESLPEECTAQQVSVTGWDGEETMLTKLVWPIALPCTDEITGSFQIQLRESFRNPESEITFPVSQDEPLEKDHPGAGLFLEEQLGTAVRTAAESELCALTVNPKPRSGAELRFEVKPSAEVIRAGESLTYTCRVENTGTQTLSDITLESSFSDQETKAVWESHDQAQVNGKQAKITSLAPGEGQTLYMTAVSGEKLSSGLTHTVVLEAFSAESQEMIRREASGTVQVTPLKASFEVEKTADRTTVVPGDTVTYQICIRNTGERTLHSVLSTERFLNANVQAQFMPKDGVTLNSTRTQALIPEIVPGEAFALLASVTIPPYFTEQELVNEVTVISEETEATVMQAESTIQVVKQYVTETATPIPTLPAYYKGAGTSGTAYAASSKPATGDRTEILLPVVLFVLSVLSGLKAYSSLKSRH